MRIILYKSEMKAIWDSFIDQSKNGLFMFKRDFMDYHSDRFEDLSLMFYQGEKLVAVLPANRINETLYSHQGLTFGGLVTDKNMKTPLMLGLFDELKSFLPTVGIESLVYKPTPYIYHKFPAQEDLYALYRNDAQVYRTDVTTTVDLSGLLPFSSLRKRGSKKALKEGVTFSMTDDFKPFMLLLNHVLEGKHGTKPVHSLEEIQLLHGRFSENIKLCTTSLNEELLAGVLIFEYDNLVHAQYIVASEKGKSIGALDYLFSTLIKETYKHKQYFDFGISTEDQGRVLNEGLISQKEGFSGRAVVHQHYKMKI